MDKRFLVILQNIWLWVGIGIALRLIQYLHNRSLWVDEASLALNLIHRSYDQLLLPLENNQAAPPGYLFATRLFVDGFGPGEYALRLLPLIAGIAALALFGWWCRRHLSSAAAAIATALFALSDSLIYYASEVKQYSSDVLVTVILLIVAMQVYQEMVVRSAARPRTLMLWGGVGALLLWFAHPTVFILAGTGLAVAAYALSLRRHSAILPLAAIALAWGISFGALYNLSLAPAADNDYLLEFWQAAFLPFPPTNFGEVLWLPTNLLAFFDFPAGIGAAALAAAASLMGGWLLFKEDRYQAALILWPMLVLLLVSALELYPATDRLALFITPSFFILVARGAEAFLTRGDRSPILTIIILGSLFFQPAVNAVRSLDNPRYSPFAVAGEELRPVLQAVEIRRQPEDRFYVIYAGIDVYHYYAQTLSLDWPLIPTSPAEGPEYKPTIAALNDLRGLGRIWFIFVHSPPWLPFHGETLMLAHLDSMSTRLDAINANGAGAYLYDLSP